MDDKFAVSAACSQCSLGKLLRGRATPWIPDEEIQTWEGKWPPQVLVVGGAGVQDLWRRKGQSQGEGAVMETPAGPGASFQPVKMPEALSLPPKGVQLPGSDRLRRNALQGWFACPHSGAQLEGSQVPAPRGCE